MPPPSDEISDRVGPQRRSTTALRLLQAESTREPASIHNLASLEYSPPQHRRSGHQEWHISNRQTLLSLTVRKLSKRKVDPQSLPGRSVEPCVQILPAAAGRHDPSGREHPLRDLQVPNW